MLEVRKLIDKVELSPRVHPDNTMYCMHSTGTYYLDWPDASFGRRLFVAAAAAAAVAATVDVVVIGRADKTRLLSEYKVNRA